jgi:hypothetical protein
MKPDPFVSVTALLFASAASFVVAIAADAFMSALTITPELMDVTPPFVMAMSPVTAWAVATEEALPINKLALGNGVELTLTPTP